MRRDAPPAPPIRSRGCRSGVRSVVAAVGAFAVLLGATRAPLAAAPAEPLCRFPGPWVRHERPARASDGTHPSPLGIAADPSVVRDATDPSRMRMYFTNADSRGRVGIALAEGRDGSTWDAWRRPASPDPLVDLVLAPPPGAWDSPGIETANVVRADGHYRMYYTGNRAPGGSATYAVGLATSPDGVRWTRRAAPVLEPLHDWERPLCADPADPGTCRGGGVLEPSVLRDPRTGGWRMWYAALGEPAGSFRTFRVGLATSPDGVRWARHPRPVLEPGAPGAWDSMWVSHANVVADPRAGFHMFYFGSAPGDHREGVEIQRGALGHAYSPDGLRWERNPANPILAPRPDGPDAWSLGGPTALVEGGRVRLWYFASPTGGLASEVVLAEAPCGGGGG